MWQHTCPPPSGELFVKDVRMDSQFQESLQAAAGLGPLPSLGLTDYSKRFYVVRNLCLGLFSKENECYLHRDHRFGGMVDSVRTLPRMMSASIVPAGRTREVRYAELLRKTTLYSDTVIVVLPEVLDGTDTNYSVSGLIRTQGTTEGLDKIWSLNAQYGELVKDLKCIFLPNRIDYTFDSPSDQYNETLTAPLIQRVTSEYPYLPLSHRSVLLDSDEMFLYKHLLLPYFPDADLLTIARLKDDYTDAFVRFTAYLKTRVREMVSAQSTVEMDDIIADIEGEIATLSVVAKKISQTRLMRGVSVATFGLSLGAVMHASNTIATSVAGVVGSVTVIQLLKEFAECRKIVTDLEGSQFYIPYLLRSEDRS